MTKHQDRFRVDVLASQQVVQGPPPKLAEGEPVTARKQTMSIAERLIARGRGRPLDSVNAQTWG